MSWQTVKLSEVAKIDRNGIDPGDIVAGTKYLGLENIETGGEILEAKTVENGELASTKFRFDANHILYGKLRPYLGKIALPNFSGICSTDILPIKPGGNIDRRYLAFFLRLPQNIELATARATGVNLPRLSPKTLASFDVPLPPLPEQQRIAAILDKAYIIRRKREQAIAMADNLLQAAFLQMFGDPVGNPKQWRHVPIGEVCTRVTVGIVVRPASYYVPSGVPALRSLNVRQGYIERKNFVYFSETDNETKLQKTRVWAGDVVAVRSGQPGKAAIIPKDLDGANAIDILVATPNHERITSEYLCDFLNSSGGRQLVLSEERGQIQKHLNVKSLKDCPIPLPPIDILDDYSLVVERIKRAKDRLSAAQKESNSLFASLAQRAFRGEL